MFEIVEGGIWGIFCRYLGGNWKDLGGNGIIIQLIIKSHKNLFENVTTVQFNHRVFAEVSLLLIIGLWWYVRRSNVSRLVLRPFQAMLIMVFIQVTLGILTLMFVVPIFVASLHQLGALILFTFSLWGAHMLRYRDE